ncbi:hypothetical protein [Microbacterium aurum]
MIGDPAGFLPEVDQPGVRSVGDLRGAKPLDLPLALGDLRARQLELGVSSSWRAGERAAAVGDGRGSGEGQGAFRDPAGRGGDGDVSSGSTSASSTAATTKRV